MTRDSPILDATTLKVNRTPDGVPVRWTTTFSSVAEAESRGIRRVRLTVEVASIEFGVSSTLPCFGTVLPEHRCAVVCHDDGWCKEDHGTFMGAAVGSAC